MAPINNTSGDRQEGQMIACRCSDGVVVEVPVEALRHSRLFDTLYTSLGGGEGGFEGDFPVQHIDSATMCKVSEWCQEHVGRSFQ